jgi:hypothetical protein
MYFSLLLLRLTLCQTHHPDDEIAEHLDGAEFRDMNLGSQTSSVQEIVKIAKSIERTHYNVRYTCKQSLKPSYDRATSVVKIIETGQSVFQLML